MTCDVSEFVDNILCDLSDQDGVRWSRKLILNYINMGIADIASEDEDGFGDIEEVTLRGPGCDFDLSHRCTKILKVLGQSGTCNTPIESSNSRNNVFQAFRDFCESAEGEYRLGSWDVISDNSLHIDPPLENDQSVTLRINCYTTPGGIDINGEIPSRICGRYLSCLKHYVMGSAYGIYSTDANMINLCTKNMQLYTNCVSRKLGREISDDDD